MAGKTEWEDALIKHGIIEAPPQEPTIDDIHSALQEAREMIDPHEGKTLDELDELEDDLDDDVMASYRAKRIAEMKQQALRNRFGELTQISEPDFIPQVNKAGDGIYVVLHLFVHGKTECRLLNQVLSKFAAKNKDVKCLKIVSTECIHNYPDKNCPTILIYKDGELVHNIVGLSRFGGLKINEKTLEWTLAQMGVCSTDIDENPLLEAQRTEVRRVAGRRVADYDSDDD